VNEHGGVDTGEASVATPAPPVTLSVLGHLAAANSHGDIDLGGPQQRAVLGVLLVAAGAVVPADAVIDAVWGEAAPARAAAAIQSYVSHLRRRLEPARTARSRDSVIVSVATGYAVKLADDAVDAWQFERLLRDANAAADPVAKADHLRAALALWRGPAYLDFTGAAWVEAEAARLTELLEVAREQLVAARLDCGESAVVVPEIEALVAAEPLREERWRLLALAYYRSHRQADALAALRRAREKLAEELGVDPGPALRAVEAEVLAQSPSLDAPTPPAAVAIPVQRAATEVVTDVLVDRDREMTMLRHCVDDVADGQGGVALIAGPAGIGKTRLLAEARRYASDSGVVALTARGSQLEKEFGFGAVRQLFEPLLTDPADRARLLAGSAASASGVFDAAVDDSSRADGSFAVLHGLYWLVVNLAAERPVVLAVDDLQWCDAGSLRALAYIVRRLEGLPVLLATTLRTGEEYDEPQLIHDLETDPATVAVQPAPLTGDGVANLVRARLGAEADDVFINACYRTTNGNPLLLRQLLRALEADGVRPDATHVHTVTAIGSRAVSSIVLMRLNRLATPATAVARAIAVLGDGAPLPTIAALADLGEAETATAVAALARAEVVRDEHPLGFVHPLVRDAIYRDVPPGERELHHERAARVLDAAGAPPERVAAHLLQIPPRGDEWVVEVLRRAATVALDRGAADGANTYLDRALLEPPGPVERPRVLVELGRVETVINGPAAVHHLREAYLTLHDPDERAQVARLLAWSLVFAGGPAEVTAFAQRAIEDLDETIRSDDRQALLALARIGGFMHGLDLGLWSGDAVEVSGTGSGARMLAAEQAWELLIDGHHRELAVEFARFALSDGSLVSVDNGLLWVVAADVLDMADEDVMPFWQQMLSRAYARGSLFASLSVHLWRGYSLWMRGELREAYDSLMTATEQTNMWGAPGVGVPYADAFRVGVILERGDLVAARAEFDALDERVRFGDGARLWDEVSARVLVLEGRYAEALVKADAVRASMTSIKNPVWRQWRSLRAIALAGLGQRDEALALMHEELELARSWGAPRCIGRTLVTLAGLEGDAGEATLREAIEVLRPTTARLSYAHAMQRLATLPSVPDDEAAPMLAEAHDIVDGCGADGLRRDIVTGLRARGLVVPDLATAPPPLTETERRISAMAADGADERTIAEALFLTPAKVTSMLTELKQRA
jgi:DNA-binding SARP family transcriptional activator